MKYNELEFMEKSISSRIMNEKYSHLVSFTLCKNELIVLFDNIKISDIKVGNHDRYVIINYLDEYGITLIKHTEDDVLNTLLGILHTLFRWYRWRLPWIIKKGGIKE